MKCDVIFCQKEIQEAKLVLVDMQGFNTKTNKAEKIHMMVPVCEACLARFQGGCRIDGSIKVIS